MPGYAKTQIDAMEHGMNEPVSPEQMEHRRQVVAELRILRSRPVTEEEKEFLAEVRRRARTGAPDLPLICPFSFSWIATSSRSSCGQRRKGGHGRSPSRRMQPTRKTTVGSCARFG